MFGLLQRVSLENSIRPEHENGNNTGSGSAGIRIRCHLYVGTIGNACFSARKLSPNHPGTACTGRREKSRDSAGCGARCQIKFC